MKTKEAKITEAFFQANQLFKLGVIIEAEIFKFLVFFRFKNMMFVNNVRKQSCYCCNVLSLLLHEKESLCVQSTYALHILYFYQDNWIWFFFYSLHPLICQNVRWDYGWPINKSILIMMLNGQYSVQLVDKAKTE